MPEQAKTSTVDSSKPAATNSASGVHGTTPAGTSDERSAADAVRQMFDEIAPRYDFLNHVLSMNIDRLWWRRTARTFSHILSRSNARVLDL
ncbi:MAG TPA: class I SAM-dependent methyltransferase, partial [Candidatus Polarisedimenticolia bacterium]|nr:class I SAM-dependent methyltransferase [Candidatus Polarisedimenticolia bacterium]